MSGIVGSKLNIRGSGRIAKLGTDGQVLTSAGAGVSAVYEDLAGGISWQSVTTGSTLTAVAGNGYPINTTSNACTVTLPASASVGDEIIFTDYARNFATNALTINPNSLNYQGNSSPNPVYDTAGESIHIVYQDTTKGWIPVNDGTAALETPQTVTIEYLVIAGGGGGGVANGGGGGAGGMLSNYDGSTIDMGDITITVGTGGAGGTDTATKGSNGIDSVITDGVTTVTSDGGGGGGSSASPAGADGGSGGGAANYAAGGSATAGQGNDGGLCTAAPSATYCAGGGGAGAAGEVGSRGAEPGNSDGGAGLANSITGSSVTYAGGGGGGYDDWTGEATGGSGGGGAGGDRTPHTLPTDGTDGLGGGGGGAQATDDDGADGGNGRVILRMSDAAASAGTATNADSTATDVGGSGETVITWLVSGSFVV